MKKPICTDKDILDFKISKNDCTEYKIDNVMLKIPLSQWTNVEELVKFVCPADKKKHLKCETYYKKYIESFDIVSKKLIHHPNVQTYACNVRLYLKDSVSKKQFEDYYQEIIKRGQDDNPDKRQDDNINDSLTFITNQLEVGCKIQESDAIETSLNLTDTEESSSSTPQQTEPTEHTVLLENIKGIIFKYAKEIHGMYQSNKHLSDQQLHAMAAGLSCILDLRDDSQCLLFSEQIWSKLLSKYTSRFKIAPVPVVKSYKDKWTYIIALFSQQNSVTEAKRFLSLMKSNNRITESEVKTFDLFELLLTLRQSKAFMLDTKNVSKVSEADYVYQIWLPILSSMFNINCNIVRIKTGETVLEGSTEAKTALYKDGSHIIGFKVDIRILADIDGQEFDLVSGEGCLQYADDNKVKSDQSKLLREGKEIEMALRKIFDGSKETIKSQGWCIQFIGATCHFSTVSATKYGYHVNVPQFSLSYPSSFFDIDDTSILDHLFTFKNSIEISALALKRIVEKNRDKIFEAEYSRTQLPLSPRSHTIIGPNWYIPPNNEKPKSKIPHHTVYESGVESSDDDIQDYKNQQPDEHGFIQTEKGWYSCVADKIFETHPYHI